jgi:branched-chain amino acid transport system substrate-binding protein
VTDAGDLAECFLDANYHWDASSESAEAVREAFMEEFGEEMRTSAVLSYQSVYIIADAIERAGSTDPADVRDALAETNYEDHILPYEGAIQFDEAGETVVAAPVMMQVQDGVINQVWPPDLAQSEPTLCTSWGG